MTAAAFRDLITTDAFRQDLEEMSSYLASIKQERPIVCLVAKHMWKKRVEFELEPNHWDLCVNNKHIEFKFDYVRCQLILKNELAAVVEQGADLKRMWRRAEAQKSRKTWGVLPRIYEDVCRKEPDLFVWIICSRDLSNVEFGKLEQICQGREQKKYGTYGQPLGEIDACLEILKAERCFSLLKHDIKTNGGLFPSIYHFRICEFPSR